MSNLFIDFETRSEVDLKQVGLWNYARHPSTDVWCMAWALDDEEPEVSTRDDFNHYPAITHIESDVSVVAHNAPFELAVWNEIMVPRYSWPRLQPEQTYCTMAMCYAMGLPGALEDAALALGLQVLKDKEGRNLMLRMARPRSYQNGKPLWWDEPDKLARLYAYCQQDVRVERELLKRLMPLSAKEREVWLMDYQINQRGVAIDLPSTKAAIELADAMKVKYDEQIGKLTGGAATTCTALGPIKEWLAVNGVPEAKDGLAKERVTDLLARPGLSSSAREVLTCRQEAGKASAAKFGVMAGQAGSDGRLHNMYQFHGAATGRWAGRAVQTHNLPRDMPGAASVARILTLIREKKYEQIDTVFGPPLTTASRCLRSFFVAPDSKVLCVGDFANIEGRGQAWFAGEQWKLDAFRAADAKTGPGIYELSYARAFHVPVETVKNPSEERQIGKVLELAFGYEGGVGSCQTMAKVYHVKVNDGDATTWKNRWRKAHPAITAVWPHIIQAAINAVGQEGKVFACGYPGREAKFKKAGSFLWCRLPSGRVICYPYPKLLPGSRGDILTYMCVPSQDDKKKSKIIADPKNASNWARVQTYGGSLFNNIVQGFCRDLLAHAMLDLSSDRHNEQVVLHTHDDIAVERYRSYAHETEAAMTEVMNTPPVWAKDFPLYAECKLMERYGK